jgi:hypothetical protein
MRWLERHAWWGLLVFAVVIVIFGVTDLAAGPAADVGIPLGLTGMTPAQLEAESAAAYRLFDISTRANGWSLAIMGLMASTILVFAFRKDRPWAWWAMWLLPIWSAGVFVFYIVAGIRADQPPPPPMISGPILAILSTAILLVSAPRFFRPGN